MKITMTLFDVGTSVLRSCLSAKEETGDLLVDNCLQNNPILFPSYETPKLMLQRDNKSADLVTIVSVVTVLSSCKYEPVGACYLC